MKINAFYRRKYVCKFLKLETYYTWFISIKQMFKILSREPVKIITIKINDNVESTNEKSTTRRKYKLKYKLRLQQPPSTRGFQRPRTFRVTKGNAPTRFFDPTHPINLPLPSISILAVYSIQCRVFIVPSREEEREREKKEHQSGYLASETARKVSKRRNDTETWAKCWPPSIKRHSTAHQSMIKPINGVARSMKCRRRVVQRSSLSMNI